MSNHAVQLSHYDYTAKETVSDGEVSIHAIAKALTIEQMAELLDNYVNNYSISYGNGVKIGEILRSSHRTLQRSVIVVLTGIISGLAHQEYTDLRNERAIALASKIEALFGEHGAGGFV